MAKFKCPCCEKKISSTSTFECRWCTQTYCLCCLSIDKHNCSNIDECKNNNETILRSKLESAKSVNTNNLDVRI